jgi:hypothetical protein
VTEHPGATPLPITFLGLALATAVVAGWETRVLPKGDFHDVGWIVLAVPVPTQLLAGVWGLVRGHLAAGTASAVLAATWLGFALSAIHSSSPSRGVGLAFFVAAAALLISVTTESIERRPVPAVVLLVASARFAVSGVAAFDGSWATAAGDLGFALAGVAVGGALAVEVRNALSS